jgi:hypothetical protein
MLLTPSLAFVILQGTTPIVVEGERIRQSPSQVVCKQTAKTNTRFAKRTCRTRAEWEQIAEQNRRDAEDMINKPGFDGRRSN